MIVVRLKGGLGNQMFQYAAGMRLTHIHGSTLKFDLSCIQNRENMQQTHRDFSLDAFHVDLNYSTFNETRISHWHRNPVKRLILKCFGTSNTPTVYYEENDLSYCPGVLNLPDNCYLNGYFQDERYFSGISPLIRNIFMNPIAISDLGSSTHELAEEIHSCQSVCLHVRRGDYVSNQTASAYHGICSVRYYEKALKVISEHKHIDKIFVFSDDPDWCRENFPRADSLVVVGDEHSGYRSSLHLWLMSLCKHFVIANSSFSWWAAWLGDSPEKIVVRPAVWYQAKNLSAVDPCPISWVSVPNQ
jgi:hypothetical protein